MISRLLLYAGIICIGLWVTFTVQAWWHQKELEREFELESFRPLPGEVSPDDKAETPKNKKREIKLEEGDLVGRLEVPRLDLSVMVMEGTDSRTLRLGAGRIPGTALPWTTGNMGIAAHRDTFFRPLKDIKTNDTITFTTVDGSETYRVTSTKIVMPTDTHVLKPTKADTLTLVTCYPFYYIGSAPKRFIVQATRE
jgi:sortase A